MRGEINICRKDNTWSKTLHLTMASTQISHQKTQPGMQHLQSPQIDCEYQSQGAKKHQCQTISKHTNTHPALHAILGTNIHFSTLARVLTVPQENAMQQRSQVRTHSKAPLQSTSAKHTAATKSMSRPHCWSLANVSTLMTTAFLCCNTCMQFSWKCWIVLSILLEIHTAFRQHKLSS